MKSIIKFSAITSCISLLILFSNCNKSKDASTNSSINYLKGEIDGVAFECSNVNFHPYYSGTIQGSLSSGSILLSLNLTTIGEHIFQDGNGYSAVLNVGIYQYSAGGGAVFSGSGKITITESNSNYVKGTFEFVTGNTNNIAIPPIVKTVSKGEFYVKRG